jgi:hypothetical protein
MKLKNFLLTTLILGTGFLARGQRISSISNGVGNGSFTKVIPSKRGGYLAIGNSINIYNDSDIFLSKLDSTGRLEWTVIFESTLNDFSTSLMEDSAKNIFICGYNRPSNSASNGNNAVLIKTDSSGFSSIVTSYGTQDAIEVAKGFFASEANEIIVYGSSDENSLTNGLVMSINSLTGQLNWTKKLEGPSGAALSISSGFKDALGNIMLAGHAGGNEKDPWASKLNPNGSLIDAWSYSIPNNQFVSKVIPKPNGGFYLLGTTSLSSDTNVKTDGFLASYSINNQMSWSRSFGTSAEEVLHDFLIIGPDSFLVAGSTKALGAKGSGFVALVGRQGQGLAKNAGDLPGSSNFLSLVFNPQNRKVLSVGNFDPDSSGFSKGLVSNLFLDSSNCMINNFNLPNQASWTSTLGGNFNFIDSPSTQNIYDASGSSVSYLDSSLCMIPTKINEIQNDGQRFIAFPNPSSGNVFIKGMKVENAEWIDVFGRSYPATGIRNERDTKFDTNHLPAGQYLLRFRSDGKAHSEKVSILRN